VIALWVHQRELLDRLRDPACPSPAVVVAPPGAGIRLPLEIRLAEVAHESLCLVVTTMQLLAAQWASRLEAAGVQPVVLLTGADAALGILEESDVPQRGVIVTTQASARRKLSSEALAEMEFELAIYDHPTRPPSAERDEPRLRARRIISLVDRLDASNTQSTIWHMTLDSLVDMGMTDVIPFIYEEGSAEREFRDAAKAALSEYAQKYGIPEALPSDSLPALHSRLLTAATRMTPEGDLVSRIWKILDRMDAFIGPDSRLRALDQVLNRVLATNTRCVVVASTVTDVNYIAEHLNATARSPRAVITGTMSGDAVQSTLASIHPGECIVATPVIAPDGRWPENTTVILWPSPANEELLPRLAKKGPGVSFIEMRNAVSV
jgi:hypothetical protein